MPKEQDSSAVERGRRAGTQARSEIGPYRRAGAFFQTLTVIAKQGRRDGGRYLDEVQIKREMRFGSACEKVWRRVSATATLRG